MAVSLLLLLLSASLAAGSPTEGKVSPAQPLLTEDPQAATPHWVELCGRDSAGQQNMYLFSEDTKNWSVEKIFLFIIRFNFKNNNT